jgi:pyruvate/2-oxoglutarate dehydrogenase complex dihydrolipoamide dehydrogenase (E3) component
MVKKKKVDAVVIGAGQSGPSLAGRLAGAGQKVALVEKRMLGGTCVNDGCIPTKTLVASARAAWVARNAARWGIAIDGDIRVDMKKVKARKDEVVQASRDSLKSWLSNLPNLELIEGHARFEGENVVRVDGQDDVEIEAERFFLNVGARALVPPIPGLADGPFLTNTTIMDVDVVPEHLVIVGGSYIALEFAQMYRRFGANVTVIERDNRLIGRDDEDVSAEIKRFLEDEGIDIRVSTTVTAIDRSKKDRIVVVAADGQRIEGSHLLVAIGRVPNTGDLGLDKAGVELDARGYIKVDDQLKTNRSNIWAIGDCNGRGAFTHTSYNDYEIVAANLLDNDPRKVSDRIPIYGLYVDPPLGRVGMTEAEAKKTGKNVLVGKRPMTRVGRAFERGETNGFIKVLVDADTKQVLGAAILGIEGDEVVHSIADVMYAKAPYTTISRAVHAHPTVSELVPTTLQNLTPLE